MRHLKRLGRMHQVDGRLINRLVRENARVDAGLKLIFDPFPFPGDVALQGRPGFVFLGQPLDQFHQFRIARHFADHQAATGGHQHPDFRLRMLRLGQRDFHRSLRLPKEKFDHGEPDGLLVSEVAVKIAWAHLRALGDIGHGGFLEPVMAEKILRVAKDFIARLIHRAGWATRISRLGQIVPHTHQ